MRANAVLPVERRNARVGALALVASTGTMVCCALPILLVSLGFGAAVAAMTSSFPFLVTLSRNKAWIFAASGVILVAAGVLMRRSGRACPTEPGRAELCHRLQRWNRRIYWGSVLIWGAGFFTAYLLLPLRIWLDV